MTIKVTFEFANVAEAEQFLAQHGGGPQPQTSAARANVAPHAPTAVVPEAPTPPAPAPTPPAQEPAAQQPAAQEPQTSAPEPAEATQAALINAFTELGKAKGRDVIAGICGEYGVQQVISIPPEKWGEAIAKAQAALNG